MAMQAGAATVATTAGGTPARLAATAALLALLPEASRAHIAGLYRHTLETERDRLARALHAADRAEVQAASHRIAGAAAMMQDGELSTALRRMEAAVRDQGLLPGAEAWQAACELIGQTQDWLQSTSPCSRA